ncbi:MAG: LacI family DNA-binding transcriptional regulator [Candidatus Methylacidiphilales bacterium]|nr:LacI family DNA-binding transcriptional regulator [Candidatus Methylacidiphilales bacterium]
MVTLKHIAANLDLSVMAVSKALRDAPDIAAATKERVRREADRLGYIPNRTARSLRGGTSGMIGLILPSLNEPYGCNIMHGLELEATARGFELLVASSQNLFEQEMQAVTRMSERQVEVLFVFSLTRNQQRSAVLEAARKFRIPLVFLDHYPPDAGQYEQATWVVVDCLKGGMLAVRHLVELGHRDIVYLAGPPTVSAAAEHLVGFQRGLQEAGLPYRDSHAFLAGLDIESGKQAMTRVLAEEVSFSAVVCASDAVAVGAFEILRRQGYRVPDDVSLVGFGDGLLAANLASPLTTIRHPQVDLGRTAFNLWLGAKTRGETLKGKVLPVELIVRESSSAPKVPLAARVKE